MAAGVSTFPANIAKNISLFYSNYNEALQKELQDLPFQQISSQYPWKKQEL